jgi:hypothetical protein
MFSIPADSHNTREGRSDNNPVILQDETVEKFTELLAVLYAL